MESSLLGEVLHIDITVRCDDDPTRSGTLGQQQPVVSPIIAGVEDENMIPRAEIFEQDAPYRRHPSKSDIPREAGDCPLLAPAAAPDIA